MPQLTITYEDTSMLDYSGASITTRTYVAKIDGTNTLIGASSTPSADVATIKASIRTLLADRGFTWSTEV